MGCCDWCTVHTCFEHGDGSISACRHCCLLAFALLHVYSPLTPATTRAAIRLPCASTCLLHCPCCMPPAARSV